ncbi:MAG: NifB/NifX family molybdenum-iron cluster-binding protein [Desulfobulbus sp.]|nr:NifB/NifX family molybdenum-iron cluster-binding protein [Desulfobulbus sp.]
MKILLTVQDNSIAPRFDQATEVIIVDRDGGRKIAEPRTIILPHRSAEELSDLIVKEGVQCVVCGGIEDSFHKFFLWKKITVIDGVIGGHGEAMAKVLTGELRPGAILPSAREGH